MTGLTNMSNIRANNETHIVEITAESISVKNTENTMEATTFEIRWRILLVDIPFQKTSIRRRQ